MATPWVDALRQSTLRGNNIRQRCCNPKVNGYKYYGGRDIKVCDRWLNSFENFLKDMGRKPAPEYTIGRINSDGDYDPVNCRWETRIQQGRSSKQAKLTMAQAREIRMLFEKAYTRRQLAKEFGVGSSNIKKIIRGDIWNESNT